jgi:hypothetical protein
MSAGARERGIYGGRERRGRGRGRGRGEREQIVCRWLMRTEALRVWRPVLDDRTKERDWEDLADRQTDRQIDRQKNMSEHK